MKLLQQIPVHAELRPKLEDGWICRVLEACQSRIDHINHCALAIFAVLTRTNLRAHKCSQSTAMRQN
jgi:hypothetical protein